MAPRGGGGGDDNAGDRTATPDRAVERGLATVGTLRCVFFFSFFFSLCRLESFAWCLRERGCIGEGEEVCGLEVFADLCALFVMGVGLELRLLLKRYVVVFFLSVFVRFLVCGFFPLGFCMLLFWGV